MASTAANTHDNCACEAARQAAPSRVKCAAPACSSTSAAAQSRDDGGDGDDGDCAAESSPNSPSSSRSTDADAGGRVSPSASWA